MKIGIYNPYLDTLGGGERYCFDIARCLVNYHDVEIFWDNPEILSRATERFHIDTTGMRVVKNIWKSGNVLTRARQSRRYDVIFFVSDGSIPFVFSPKAFLLFQFPVPWVNGRDFLTKLKVSRITSMLCYSEFVKRHLDRTFGRGARVLVPAVDIALPAPSKKERLILSVGRFTTGMNTKKQDVLVSVFKRMYGGGLTDWKLVLAGGLLPSDTPFMEQLKEEARGYPIEIIPNASFAKLQELYGRACIYWHAAGFGENLETHPERAEHFGLTTIEAMSAGAVPVVFAGGGQKEVVADGVNGFLWKTEDELIRHTQLLGDDTKTWNRISRAARGRAKEFSRERFCSKLRELV